MSKPIKSYDPRKPAIVAAIKKASNCRKVTNVREDAPGIYSGDCMNPNPGATETGRRVQVEVK